MHIQPEGLIWAVAVLLLGAALSLILQLGIARSMILAGIRAILQLFLIGFFLSYLFQLQNLLLTGATILIMTGIASHAVLNRISDLRYPQVNVHVFLSLVFGVWLLSCLASTLVLESGSWKRSEVLLPFVGLLLGNSVSGVSLGLAYWMRSLRSEREKVETRLAYGATAWEAVHPVFTQAISTAMTPILNSMSVAGIVSLPGMMTGQILAGADIQSAVHYQIAALLLISTSTLLGVLFAIGLGYRSLFNHNHQLDHQRLFSHA